MSPDEAIVTVIAVVFGPLWWAVWLFQMSRVQAAGGRRRHNLATIAIALAASTAAILYILNTAASFDVVDAPMYQFMYVVLGLAWMSVCCTTFAFAGVSPRDDAIERGNQGAASAIAGALLAVAFCYAGGNVGDGPGWWVVVFAAGLATATLMIAWIAIARFSPVTDAVTIDRDPAAGVRLGAILASCGLLLGRGVAGDWFSAAETVSDFLTALPPVAALAILSIAVERIAKPTPDRPRAPIVAFGVLPSILYLAVAIGALSFIRWPE
ncbi:MAG TPA: hypothetical protein VH740_21245 [Vicinamibacterales bacterium]|jgi:hypothetical protein